MLPPAPLTAWHFTQPLSLKRRSPAMGSCCGLNSGCCAEDSAGSSAASSAARTASRITPAILEPRPRIWQSRLLEREFQDARHVRVADLGVVEHGHAEGVRLLHVGELHVEVAVGGELAPEHQRVGAVLPRRL